MTTRVLIASASAVVRAGLEAIINADSTLEVAGTSTGVLSIPQHVEVSDPEVILLDVERLEQAEMPRLVSMSRQQGAPAIVLLVEQTDEAGIAEALRVGAKGVLPRGAQPEEIVAAVKATAAGLMAFHVDNAESLLPVLAPSAASASSLQTETLTPREIEVLGMLAEGAGNKMVARRLGISEHTVKFHVGSILGKLNASSRTEAVTIGVRLGLIML
jgi:NarL family two-component system response regulator YdfI